MISPRYLSNERGSRGTTESANEYAKVVYVLTSVYEVC